MLLEALTQLLVQRFHHEKRARVCLWFDQHREFARLLPAFRTHLESLPQPPFRLLEYDAGARHGQLWLKWEIHRTLRMATEEEQKRLRFVVYLPFPENRLEHPGSMGEPPLEFLAEYRVTGILWRIGGKQPRLFSFLRQVGVPLPDAPAEQRRLSEGGPDSLLAKYVAKFADRPVSFWTKVLTPELAQSNLLDLEETILDLATDPEGAWAGVVQGGLEKEFLELLQERYGYRPTAPAPAEWLSDFIARVALTEAFLGYGEPDDFPFRDRLPPQALRQEHLKLLARWLRDSESRARWDRWIQGVETRIDLSHWAQGRGGRAFGFPHLVMARWRGIRAAFEEAAKKTSATKAFFDTHREWIAQEAQVAGNSGLPLGSWALLRELDLLLQACAEGEALAANIADPAELARMYVERVPAVELRHLRVLRRAGAEELPAASRVADRAYGSYARALNEAFFAGLLELGRPEPPGIPPITLRLADTVWNVRERRAVIIVDGLRYDCAHAVSECLTGYEVTLEPVLAPLPTVTPVGMTALLPLAGTEVSLGVKGNALHPRVGGTDMGVLENRIAFMKSVGAHCMEVREAENAVDPPSEAADLLVVFGHDTLDRLGHDTAYTLVRHLHDEIDRLARLIRKLHRWGYPTVHLVTDHGFILLDEERLPPEVPCDQEWCLLRKERFAIVRAGLELPVASFPMPWNPELRVAVPPGLAFFKAEKSFSHGGASLQELIVPHLVSRSRVMAEKAIGVEVVLPVRELICASVKVILRPKAPEPATPQMQLFTGAGRTLVVDVFRRGHDGARISVLASGPREVRLETEGGEQSLTLFFHSALAFSKGEVLDLDIRDADTGEQFPPGGQKLIIGRDM